MATTKPAQERPSPTEQLGDALKATPQRPMDRDKMSNDSLALRQLAGEMNQRAALANPKQAGGGMTLPTEGIPGAVTVLPPGQDVLPPAQVLQATPSVPQPLVAAPVVATVRAKPERIFLTGRQFSGKHYLAARLAGFTAFDLSAAPVEFSQRFLGTAVPQLIAELTAWGNGVVNAQYPLSWVRACVKKLVDDEKFGAPHYWVDRLLAGRKGRIILLGVEDSEDFLYLRNKLGFVHFHVLASQQTIARRSGNPTGAAPAADALSAAVERDIVAKVSAQRQGERLRVIWNDPDAQPVSNRFYSADQWLSELGESAFPAPSFEGVSIE